MSDKKLAQPIRTEQDADNRVHVKLVDANAPDTVGNQMEVSESLAHVRVHGEDPAGIKVQLKLSEQGHVNSQGDYDASTNTVPASAGLVAHDRATTPGLAQQKKRVTAVTNDTVHALDVAIRDESGAAFSESNPMPVFISGDTGGDEVNDYNTSADVAVDAPDNHDYEVPALKTLYLKKISAAASGRARYEFQIEDSAGAGTFTTREVKFGTASNPNVEFNLADAPIEVATGVIVRVIRTNTDKEEQDVYSTIKGYLK